MTPFQLITWVINLGLWAAVGVAACVSLLFLLTPQARLLSRVLRTVAMATSLAVAAFSFGHIHGATVGRDAKSELAQLREQIKAKDERAKELQKQAIARSVQIQRLEGIAEDYAEELENGTTNSCAGDPAYDNRLRRILGD